MSARPTVRHWYWTWSFLTSWMRFYVFLYNFGRNIHVCHLGKKNVTDKQTYWYWRNLYKIAWCEFLRICGVFGASPRGHNHEAFMGIDFFHLFLDMNIFGFFCMFYDFSFKFISIYIYFHLYSRKHFFETIMIVI